MTTDEGRSEGEDMSEPFVTVLREIRDNPNSFSLYVIASWCDKAADLLEANAAEIATANALMDDMCTRIEGLEAENEKLRAVFKAAMYISRHSSNDSWSAFVAACEAAGGFEAAVEQSEAGHKHCGHHGMRRHNDDGTTDCCDCNEQITTASQGSPDAWL